MQYVQNYFRSLYETIDVSAIFFAAPSYRYRKVKNEQIIMKNEEITGITGYKVNDVGISDDGIKTTFNITITHSGGTITDQGVITVINGNDYFVTENNVYRIPTMEFGPNGELLSTDAVIVHVAQFKNGQAALKTALEKENGYDKDSPDSWKNMIIYFSDFLSYVVGEKVFADEVERDNIYFSATIKDAPQAKKIRDEDGDVEVCEAGEYVYNHQGVFVKSFKCIADEDVKDSDTKQIIGSNRYGGWGGDKVVETAVGDYNYYNTSVNVGWVEIILKGGIDVSDDSQIEVKFHFVGDTGDTE